MTTSRLCAFFPDSPRDALCSVYRAHEMLKCDAKGLAKNVVYMELQEGAVSFETDPGFPPDGRHSDWAVFAIQKDKSTFFELKGRHIEDAGEQLASTIRYVLEQLDGFPAPHVAYCVTSGGHPRIPRPGNATFVRAFRKKLPGCTLKFVRSGSTVSFS